jgi:hypothetical protein
VLYFADEEIAAFKISFRAGPQGRESSAKDDDCGAKARDCYEGFQGCRKSPQQEGCGAEEKGSTMRKLSSIVLEISRQGHYLDRMLRVERLNKMAWVEFRQTVKAVSRLMFNLTDFNAVHFGLSSLRRRKRSIKASKAAARAPRKERKAQNG